MRSGLFEGKSLYPSARTLWEVQAFAQKPPVEVSTNLYTYIRERAKTCIDSSRKARESITDMQGLRARQETVREAFLRSIGELPDDAALLGATVGSCADSHQAKHRHGIHEHLAIELLKTFSLG